MKRWNRIGMLVVALGCAAWCPGQQAEPAKPARAVDTSPLVHEADLNAPVDEVWRVFSTAEGLKKLGVAQARVDFRVGGKMQSSYNAQAVLGDEGSIENTIIAFEPMRMVAWRISKPPKGFPYMAAYKDVWSVVTLTDLGDGRTHLRLAQVGYTADEESQQMREFFEKGNGWVLKKLQAQYDSSVKPETRGAHAADPLGVIETEALVPGTRADVWKTYTTSAGWKKFCEVESEIGSRPGDRFEVYFGATAPAGERGSEGCTILSVVPEEMFSYTWNAPPKFAHARAERTWVVVTFEEVSAKLTRVRLRHLGFTEQAAAHADHREEWTQVRAYFAAAWPRVLGALKGHFEPKAAPVAASDGSKSGR